MRKVLDSLEREFDLLHSRSLELLETFPESRLFEPHGFDNSRASSFGIEVIRSAAEIEKSFGGITTRLWDDPFEWTLPEELSDRSAIKNYLEEVRSTRSNGLRFIKRDDELSMEIPAPEKFVSLSEILAETMRLSSFHLHRAAAICDRIKSA
jgi:hypothetical protein